MSVDSTSSENSKNIILITTMRYRTFMSMSTKPRQILTKYGYERPEFFRTINSIIEKILICIIPPEKIIMRSGIISKQTIFNQQK